MIDSKEFRKIVRFCQKNGIFKFKSGDFEIELTKTAPSSRVGESKSEAQEPAFPNWDSLTPEEKLLWSSTPDINAGNHTV